MHGFVKVADKGQLAPGRGMTVNVAGKAIALFNVEETFHAVDNTCLHRGGPLGSGSVDGKMVSCPLHGLQYDVTTGSPPMRGGVQLATYPVKVVGNDVLVSV